MDAQLERALAEAADWRNVASRAQAAVEEKEQLAEAEKRLAEEWSKRADAERKRRKYIAAKYKDLQTALEEAQADLAAANTERQLVLEAATQLVDAIVPPAGNDAPVPFMERLQRAPGELHSFIRDTAHVCMTQILGIVKALTPGLDMKPFVTGRVPGRTEDDLSLLEKEVGSVADAVVDRMEF